MNLRCVAAGVATGARAGAPGLNSWVVWLLLISLQAVANAMPLGIGIGIGANPSTDIPCLQSPGDLHRTAPAPSPFSKQTIVPMALEIAPTALEHLRQHPRERVHGSLRSAGSVPIPIAVRLKGSTGSFRTIDDKPSFTVDLVSAVPTPGFYGLRRFYLNNSVEDPTYLHEQLATEVFQAQGIPAPRVGHARVRLNGRALGIYVLKEGFTEEFLVRSFGRSDGILCDNDAGADVDQPLHRNLAPPSSNNVNDPAVETADLAAAALEPNLALRWQQLGLVLDRDRFLTFVVLEVLLGHRDGYSLARNNFRLYRDPETRRWIFLPDGMDQLFGLASFPWQPRMSGIVSASLMETPDGRRAYTHRFKELMDVVFRNPPLTARVEQLAATLKPELTWVESSALAREIIQLKGRIQQREQDLRRQIAESNLSP